MSDALRLQGVRRRWGSNEVLRGIDLHARPGEVVAILGANGAGKTTLLRIAAGLLEPTGGEASVLGEDPWRSAERLGGRVAFAPSDLPPVEPEWTPRRYLRFFARLHGVDARRAHLRILDLAGGLGFEEHLQKPLRHLSSGNRRKVELARVMLHGAEVLLLDEPTRELDVAVRRRAWERFRAAAAGGAAVLLATHDLAEVEQVAHRAAILHSGRIAWMGPPGECSAHLEQALAPLGG